MESTTNQTEEEEPTFEEEETDFSEVDTSVFEYESQGDGTVIITGLMEDVEEVVIPKTIDGMKVIGIGGYAFVGNSVTSIKIPDGVTNIEDSAFEACSSLSSVKIPDSVTSIGRQAFYGCSNLSSIEILPDSVAFIGEEAFADCSSLTSIKAPKDSYAESWFIENGFSVDSY